MLFATLLASIDVNSPEYKAGYTLGVMAAGVGCGLWPLITGLRKDRPVLAILGFFVCIPSASLMGCLLALPVAFVFKLLIDVVGPPRPARRDDGFDAPEYNPYGGNGKRSDY